MHGGKIFTADDMLSMASVVALRGNHIIAVDGEELLHRYGSETVINLDGRFVVPGFNDSHIHISRTHRRDVQLSGVKSIREIKQRVRTKAGELGPGQWITGYGWAEGMLAEQRMPHRKGPRRSRSAQSDGSGTRANGSSETMRCAA
jgi:predicted amidohydrolase YtcJ